MGVVFCWGKGGVRGVYPIDWVVCQSLIPAHDKNDDNIKIVPQHLHTYLTFHSISLLRLECLTDNLILFKFDEGFFLLDKCSKSQGVYILTLLCVELGQNILISVLI